MSFGVDNETSTLPATTNHPLRPPHYYPGPKPTVSLDARPIVIPILSCVISFPVLAFAIICALRYRAQRLRRRDQLRRLHGGFWWSSEYGWTQSKGQSRLDSTKSSSGRRRDWWTDSNIEGAETSWSERCSQYVTEGIPEGSQESVKMPVRSSGIISAAINSANQSAISHLGDPDIARRSLE